MFTILVLNANAERQLSNVAAAGRPGAALWLNMAVVVGILLVVL